MTANSVTAAAQKRAGLRPYLSVTFPKVKPAMHPPTQMEAVLRARVAVVREK